MPTNPSPDPEDPRTIPDETFLEAVREALADGRTDVAEGGVPARVVADRLDVDERTARVRLAHLVSTGHLTRVWGLSPDLCRPRASFIPSDGGRR